MSNEVIQVSPEAQVKNEAFLKEQAEKGTLRYIYRHSLLARVTHGICASTCILLAISGLFVFIPALAQWAGQDVTYWMRMAHRGIGIIFVVVPLISLAIAPKGAVHIVKNLFAKWTSDDKKWMVLFLPYLFLAKYIHMPDQDEVKSGQRFADGMLWFAGILMAVTGVALMVGSYAHVAMPGDVRAFLLLLHDIGFFLICIFGLAHIFLGGGIFQPYRGMHRVMWGDGMISESDALYHWGHWARKVFNSKDKKSIVEK